MASSYAVPTTMSDLKQYVTGSSTMQQCADSTVLLHITHNHLKAKFPELRFDLHMTIAAVKHKVHQMCGSSVQTMQLGLRDESGRPVASLLEDSRMLGFYGVRSGWTLAVTDTDASSLAAQGWLEDTSKVDKYVMSEADYSARDNTYRKFKEGKLREDPGWSLEKEMAARAGRPYTAKAEASNDSYEAEASTFSPGQRCCVDPGQRRGEIKFVGKVAGLAPGWWVGVALDEPLGKGDGAVKGARYFTCPPSHGTFVRPDKAVAGDFPPLDDLCDLGSDDEI